MGLHINKQADLDEMLNKFAKINPKNNQRSDFMKKDNIDDQDIETKKRNKFLKRNEKK
ncbi:SPJ_0845 family protein [Fructilactobacillus lindneri]|uniref:Uncharacterized protein n=1 Tax=Fructilactobacillus lindneri DSM 20690 = JCM 11027 TaxID=1122148 RepID=A0A0R2JU76_9LACO|nr:SPJ_0845 family protein [Fructilactobacillus lindneri]KRN80671.1 hypothetical protein IV52_GL001227 [Fructilactobacillus lindneri DSM 20690 = JCM 11027]SKA00664.1 hypothetical protein SAMN02746042_01115 [Fructilactobacillus lindneri DSM 20690 = JCM 11027]